MNADCTVQRRSPFSCLITGSRGTPPGGTASASFPGEGMGTLMFQSCFNRPVTK